MAALQCRNNSWRIIFRYEGKQHSFPVGEVPEAEAEAWKGRIELLLLRLRQKLLAVPEGMGLIEFLQNDGKPPEKKEDAKPVRTATTLGTLRDEYLRIHRSSLEPNTVATIETHFRHLVRHFGERKAVASIDLAALQEYVRSREGAVQAGTIRMEIVSLRTAWNWGVRFGRAEAAFPGRGLRYPKSKEKPPFMTWDEIERRIALGGDAEELWDCLYLTPEQVAEMLACVKAKAIQPWVYPLAAFAAHTGARRSELLRVRVEDIDLEGCVATIREKKRRRGVDSTRRVPMSSLLLKALAEYLAVRADGAPVLFTQAGRVARSKTKRAAATCVTKDEAHNHLKRALAGGKWKVVRGFHVLRHSMVSALANKGVDQRVIQDMVGHMTPEVHRRYAHLYPSTKEQAVKSVFG